MPKFVEWVEGARLLSQIFGTTGVTEDSTKPDGTMQRLDPTNPGNTFVSDNDRALINTGTGSGADKDYNIAATNKSEVDAEPSSLKHAGKAAPLPDTTKYVPVGLEEPTPYEDKAPDTSTMEPPVHPADIEEANYDIHSITHFARTLLDAQLESINVIQESNGIFSNKKFPRQIQEIKNQIGEIAKGRLRRYAKAKEDNPNMKLTEAQKVERKVLHEIKDEFVEDKRGDRDSHLQRVMFAKSRMERRIREIDGEPQVPEFIVGDRDSDFDKMEDLRWQLRETIARERMNKAERDMYAYIDGQVDALENQYEPGSRPMNNIWLSYYYSFARVAMHSRDMPKLPKRMNDLLQFAAKIDVDTTELEAKWRLVQDSHTLTPEEELRRGSKEQKQRKQKRRGRRGRRRKL